MAVGIILGQQEIIFPDKINWIATLHNNSPALPWGDEYMCNATLSTGLPRYARNDTAGAVKQNRAVREGCGKDASPQATHAQKTTSLRGMK